MSSQDRHSVLIVDDHPLLRDAVETALKSAADAKMHALHASTLKQAVDLLHNNLCALVLLDLQLPDTSGFEGLTQIKVEQPELPVAIVSATDSADAIARARRLGASGYLPKSLGLEELSKAIAELLAGRTWFPELNGSALDPDVDPTLKLASLTPAQRRVLDGLSDGLLNKQIAFEMGISQATVKAHLTAIFRKLGVGNRTQALIALRDGADLSTPRDA